MKTYTQEELDKIVTEREAEVRAKIQMEYLLAFGNYVPLGGEDSEPETMAKEVIRMWTTKTRDEVIEEAIGVIPLKVGYVQHMYSKTAYDEGNGWDEYRTAALASLEQMKEKKV